MSKTGEHDQVQPPSPSVDFAAGVIAGAAGLVVGQPLDVVKVRYQTPQYAGRYTSIAGAFRDIVKEETVSSSSALSLYWPSCTWPLSGTRADVQARGLFKGVLSPMAGIAFINGVVFTSYSSIMHLQIRNDGTGEPSLGKICLAGAGSGMVGALLTCPTELVKIRQQSAPPHLNPSVLDVCRDIVRTSGPRGLYRGFSATLVRELAYGPYFCSYEAMCRFFKWRRPTAHQDRAHHHESLIDEAERELESGLGWAELMTAGGVAGVTAWIATFPFDVFKTRMQSTVWPAQPGQPGQPSTRPPPPPGLWATATRAIRAEGWRVMFAGLGPTLVRAVPTNMVIFLTFEACVATMTR